MLIDADGAHSMTWHADGRFTRLEGAPCADYAAALAASWRLRPTSRDPEGPA
jgi:hypothetical protein